MTKRDVADLVLLWMAPTFLVALLGGLSRLGSDLWMPDAAAQVMGKAATVGCDLVILVLLLAINYALWLKRSWLLKLVVPGPERALTLPKGLEVMASYTFWIRMFGLYTFLSYGVRLVSFDSGRLAFWKSGFWSHPSELLLATGLGLLLVWKAELLARLLGLKPRS